MILHAGKPGPMNVPTDRPTTVIQRSICTVRQFAYRSPPIEQVRWLFFAFSMLNAGGVLALLLWNAANDPPRSVLGIGAITGMAAQWWWGWRRRSFPVWASVTDAAATFLLVVGAGTVDFLLGVLYVGLYFRSSYGRLPIALAHSVLIVLGLFAGQLLLVDGALDRVPVSVWTGLLAFPLVALVMHILASSLSEQHASSMREQELRSALGALERAHERVAQLEGILPTCAYCHRIRTEDGSWTTLEHLVEAHVATTFSHGICDCCLQREFPDFAGP